MKGVLSVGLLVGSVLAQAPASVDEIPRAASESAVLQAMGSELERSLDLLGSESVAPYYLAYEITEHDSRRVASSSGLTLASSHERRRLLDVDLRVGSYELDNTHPVRDERAGRRGGDRFSFVEVPLDDDVASIRSVLWRATDAHYRKAVEKFTAVQANVRVKVEEADDSPDFSPAPAVVAVETPAPLALDLEAWQERVNRYSRPFSSYDFIYSSEATLTAVRETRWFASSDGTRLSTSRIAHRLDIRALTKADDGMELPRYETFFAYSVDDLPGDEEVLDRVDRMIGDLEALRAAPVVEPYTGPAILSGRAAAVFFHEVFGHRVEGHRQKREDEGQTFKSKVGERILPAEFSVSFDPTRSSFADGDLAGHYRYDNEGVVAERVEAIADGVFRHFLMSRSPIDGEPRSNGHGRRQAGFPAVSRQSNLIVESSSPLSEEALEARLIDKVVASGSPFGLIFEDIQGGFTQTGRRVPNAFNVLPILVYRLYPDGRREMVRGVDLIGTPLTAFSRIVAANDRVEIFNGTCGAESGGVPVAAVAPGILVEQVEVQRKEKSQARPPLLPAPPRERAP